jgi:hypothetical protein
VHLRRSIGLLLVLLLAALPLSGCGLKGEQGGEVAAAILAASKVQSRSFSGSLKMQPTGKDAGAATRMDFHGAIDTLDDARPKMAMTMTAGGESTAIIVPGDGKLYFTAAGRSYSMAIPSGGASESTIDPRAIYAALADAVGSFKTSPPLTNAAGQSVPTVSAKVSKSKLCGPVLAAFGQAVTSASGIGSQLGAATGGKGGAKVMAGFCKSMLKSDPRLWFGIDGGRLTDVVLSADLEIPLSGPVKLEVIYHEFNQDRPQTGFDPPAGAIPITSPAQLSAG